MTPQTLTAMEARKGFGDLMNKVSLIGKEFIVERSGKPLMAMIPVEKLLLLQKDQKEAKAKIKNIWKKMKGENQKVIEESISEALSAIRAS